MPKCPICKREIPPSAADAPLPFCGQRCKLADLGSWLSGSYVVSEALPFGEGMDLDLAELAREMADRDE